MPLSVWPVISSLNMPVKLHLLSACAWDILCVYDVYALYWNFWIRINPYLSTLFEAATYPREWSLVSDIIFLTWIIFDPYAYIACSNHVVEPDDLPDDTISSNASLWVSEMILSWNSRHCSNDSFPSDGGRLKAIDWIRIWTDAGRLTKRMSDSETE
jgi:hypothetical protein